MGGVVVERGDRMLLTVATVAAAVVVVSILTGAIVGGDIPEALWFLLVPVGMLGGGVLAVLALAVFLVRRARPSRS